MIFRETLSYNIVSLLEEMSVKRKYINIFKYLYKMTKFKFFVYRNLNKDIPTKIKLFESIFKERFYLEDVCRSYNIQAHSKLVFSGTNNNLICELYYGDLKVYTECNLFKDIYSIYLLNSKTNKGINLTEKDLLLKLDNDFFRDVLILIYKDIALILNTILLKTLKGILEVKR